jgi:hypothetical protein
MDALPCDVATLVLEGILKTGRGKKKKSALAVAVKNAKSAVIYAKTARD